MKIRELSKMSYVNPETIRVYRNKGMLRPVQDERSGYYEYSAEDLLNVLYIRKLTGSNLSLDTVSYTYEHSDLSDILEGYRREVARLDAEVEKLLKRQHMLKITMDHLEEYCEHASGISLINAFDTRYDLYFEKHSSNPAMGIWMKNIELFTQTVGIRREILSMEPLPENVPVHLGIGSYDGVLRAYHLPMPEEAIVFPKGTYVTSHVSLDDLHFISRSQLEPMMDYVKQNHYVIDSDATAFLFRIDHSGARPRRIYRLRVKVADLLP